METIIPLDFQTNLNDYKNLFRKQLWQLSLYFSPVQIVLKQLIYSKGT